MCCPKPHHYTERFTLGMPATACGCGCIGMERSGWHLENYKAYLEAELASVEKQIHATREEKS